MQDNGQAGVLMWGNPKLTLEDVTFENIDGCSVLNFNNPENPNLTTNNLIHLNTVGEICGE